jgi:hypothetical protein
MIARYSPQYGRELEVELWGKRRGFTLALTFEAEYELDHAKRDAFVPGLNRYEKDHFFDRYYHLFEPLNHYTKATWEGQDWTVRRLFVVSAKIVGSSYLNYS